MLALWAVEACRSTTPTGLADSSCALPINLGRASGKLKCDDGEDQNQVGNQSRVVLQKERPSWYVQLLIASATVDKTIHSPTQLCKYPHQQDMTEDPAGLGLAGYSKIQGVFLHWASPKKLKYGKPRLGESTLT